MRNSNQIIVPHRYHGPPNSGNGGYTSGWLAAFFDGQYCP
jgi:hypothetical protein